MRSHAKRVAFRLSVTKVTEFLLETPFSCAAVPQRNHKTQNLGDNNPFFLPADSPSVLLSRLFKRCLLTDNAANAMWTFTVKLDSQFLHLITCNTSSARKRMLSVGLQGCKRPESSKHFSWGCQVGTELNSLPFSTVATAGLREDKKTQQCV